MPCHTTTRQFWMCSFLYRIRSVPHFSALWTGIRTVRIGKVNEWEQGLEPTEMEENIQERGLEFSVPNPLSQLLQHNVPRPLLFIPCWIAFHVNTRSYLVYHIMINISVYLKKTLSNLMINWETLPLNSIGFFLCNKIWLFIKSANGIILPTSLNIQMRELRK